MRIVASYSAFLLDLFSNRAFALVRPHFFMENFLEGHHLATITKESKIYSATQNGSKPFIAAFDIANVVKVALIDDKPHNTDYVVTGNESLTYDDVSAVCRLSVDLSAYHSCDPLLRSQQHCPPCWDG